VKMASQLVRSLSGDFTVQHFTDAYAEQLDQLVEAKLEQGDAVDTEATFGEESDNGDADVIDLMEALRQSVDRARRGGTEDTKKSSPAKKTASAKKSSSARKSTSTKKSSAAKKSTSTKKSNGAKKSSAKKSAS